MSDSHIQITLEKSACIHQNTHHPGKKKPQSRSPLRAPSLRLSPTPLSSNVFIHQLQVAAHQAGAPSNRPSQQDSGRSEGSTLAPATLFSMTPLQPECRRNRRRLARRRRLSAVIFFLLFYFGSARSFSNTNDVLSRAAARPSTSGRLGGGVVGGLRT